MSRAADVILKERRKLVLAFRETPLHTGHLRTLLQLSELGAVVCPVVPAFYNHPKTIDDIIGHPVGRLLDLFEVENEGVRRWKETDERGSAPLEGIDWRRVYLKEGSHSQPAEEA